MFMGREMRVRVRESELPTHRQPDKTLHRYLVPLRGTRRVRTDVRGMMEDRYDPNGVEAQNPGHRPGQMV